jgi:hypothetical protein
VTAPYVPVKYPYIGGTRWNFMKWADIPDARDIKRVYLRRLRILQTPWFALYLHFIYMPDEDRDPHDHPFSFKSLIVRGGYTEQVWPTCDCKIGKHLLGREEISARTWKRGSIHRTSRNVAHMITTLKPGTITLVWAGAKKQEWGFYPGGLFEPWQSYNREKYDEFS